VRNPETYVAMPGSVGNDIHRHGTVGTPKAASTGHKNKWCLYRCGVEGGRKGMWYHGGGGWGGGVVCVNGDSYRKKAWLRRKEPVAEVNWVGAGGCNNWEG